MVKKSIGSDLIISNLLSLIFLKRAKLNPQYTRSEARLFGTNCNNLWSVE